MAEEVKDTEVETEENTTTSTEEVQEKVTLKMIKEKLTDMRILVKEQGEKNATKKDVWKGVAVTVTSIAISVLLGV